MATLDLGNQAVLFVTNVLNGTVAAKGGTVFGGTVLRLVLRIPRFGLPLIKFSTTIGSGFPERTEPAALVIGPTGVGLGPNGACTSPTRCANRIAAIPDAVFRSASAGAGFTVSRGHHLNGPLGLVVAPGGDILTVNSGDGNLVEVTPFGSQIAVRTLDTCSPPGAGALFGLAVKPFHRAVYFVDDATNTLDLLHSRAARPRSGPARQACDYSVTPTSTGSGASETPNASRTPSLISAASAISAAVVADPALTRASVCLDEIRAPSPRLYPLPNPARSISQAAGTFTRPSPASNLGTRVSSPQRTRAAVSTTASAAASSTGLTKNEPTLRVSGSAGSMTMPLRCLSSRTALTRLGALHPVTHADPQGGGQLGVADRHGQGPVRRAGRSRSSTTNRRAIGLEETGPVAESALPVRDNKDFPGGAGRRPAPA